MRAGRSRDLVSAIAVVIVSLPAWVTAESSVESFTSKVNSGAVKQTTTGSGNSQDLNVGSANSTKANSFNADVTTGSITQTSRGTGIVQSANIGSANNSKVGSFTSTVVVGNIEQVSTRSGDRQELDIGSVNNSTVNGKFNVDVKVKDGVKQTGAGEIVLGSVKNSSIQNFSTNLEVKGKVTGNNIRIGSIVGQERLGNNEVQEKHFDISPNERLVVSNGPEIDDPISSSPEFKEIRSDLNKTEYGRALLLKLEEVAKHTGLKVTFDNDLNGNAGLAGIDGSGQMFLKMAGSGETTTYAQRFNRITTFAHEATHILDLYKAGKKDNNYNAQERVKFEVNARNAASIIWKQFGSPKNIYNEDYYALKFPAATGKFQAYANSLGIGF